MSAVKTNAPAAEAEEKTPPAVEAEGTEQVEAIPEKSVPEQVADLIAEQEIRADAGVLLALGERLSEVVENIRKDLVHLTGLRKRAAGILAEIRLTIILPNGVPDIAGRSRVYSLLVSEFLDNALPGFSKADRRRERDTIRKYVAERDNFLGQQVAEYVLAQDSASDSPQFKGATLEAVTENPPEGFAEAVNALYSEATGAIGSMPALPEKSQPKPLAVFAPQAHAEQGDGGPGAIVAAGGLPSGWTILEQNRAQLAQFSPKVHAAGILLLASNLAEKLRDGRSEIADREEVKGYVARTEQVASLLLKYLEGKTWTPTEEKTFAASLFGDADREEVKS